MMPRPGKTGVAGIVPFGIPGMDANDNKPKGKMTAYAFFVQICRDEHKRKHPDEQVSLTEFTKKCSERWKTMTEKEKRRFNQMADADKKVMFTAQNNTSFYSIKTILILVVFMLYPPGVVSSILYSFYILEIRCRNGLLW